MTASRTALALGLLVLAIPTTARGGKTIIRTFVNGIPESEGTVHDLHIDLSQDYQQVRIVSGQQGTFRRDGPGHDSPRTIDIDFARPLRHGESISVRIETAAGSLAVRRFWWTDAEHETISRTIDYRDDDETKEGPIERYPGWMRGDETIIPLPLPTQDEDPYAIHNKRHHFGGAARANQEVCIELDMRALLRRPPGGLGPAAIQANVEGAARQWSECSYLGTNRRVPRATGDNANHGANDVWIDPPVMAPGPTHNNARGETFRSLTDRECDAVLLKYPCGIRIEVITAAGAAGCSGPRTGGYQGPAGCTQASASDGVIQAGWGGRIPGSAIGYGPPTADEQAPDRTASGRIHMRRSPRGGWSTATDANGDGWITNEDPGPPDDAFDFYSVFEHELGHVLCFSHSGSNYFEPDEHAHFADPTPLRPALPGTPLRPFPSAAGDVAPEDPGWVMLAAELPDGLGGTDLAQASLGEDGWSLAPLGEGINSPADEVDPVVGSDGTTLIFSSDRGGVGHLVLYEAVYDVLSESWQPPVPIPWSLEAPADQRGATLSADMRTLVFASDDPRGAGGFDLWAAEWIPGDGWSEPFVLGDSINTAADEHEPAWSGDGRMLYFSSDRDGGAGGFDLYATSWQDELGWREPVPLTELNGPQDERNPATRLDATALWFTRGPGPGTVMTAARVRGAPPSEEPPAGGDASAGDDSPAGEDSAGDPPDHDPPQPEERGGSLGLILGILGGLLVLGGIAAVVLRRRR